MIMTMTRVTKLYLFPSETDQLWHDEISCLHFCVALSYTERAPQLLYDASIYPDNQLHVHTDVHTHVHARECASGVSSLLARLG